MLEADGITRSYGEVSILRGVSLNIAAGEMVTLLGASGAGKTTLLQILGTLETPDNGKLLFESHDLLKYNTQALARFRNEKLGFIFQFHHLLAEFSALENVCMPAWLKGTATQAAKTQATQLLTQLNLAHRLDHRPAQLSGGEQQRVAVARALINSPRLILADEPTGNLDTANGKALFMHFRKLADETGVAFLIATHNEELARMAHRALRMEGGLVV